MNINREIEHIINGFDFEKVHTVMTFLDWGWWGQGVPTISALKGQARELLLECMEEDEYTIVGSGGLLAREHCWDNGDEDTYYTLDFQLAEASSRWFE